MWFALPWLAGCSSGPDLAFLDTPPPERSAPVVPGGLALTHLEPASLTIPATNRPGGAVAGDEVPLVGSFSSASWSLTDAGGARYRLPLPLHVSVLPDRTGAHGIGNHAPPGFEVTLRTGETTQVLPFDRFVTQPHAWGYDERWLYVIVPEGAPAPTRDDLTIQFPRAAQAEAALNLVTSQQTPADFVRRTVTVARESHRGLYLPAPAEAVYRLTVPERGVLTFHTQIVPPNYAGAAPSDGADVVVSVRAEGQVHALGEHRARLGAPEAARVDLARFAGQSVELVLATEPGGTPDFDYVFLEDPVVYTPTEDPKRVVLVFVDTLRPDHLGFMGYARPTSPILDRWSRHAAVFEQARTVAPWTLPSALAALSGEQPERWPTATSLAERLTAAGWRTDAIVTNAFLSQAFDTHRGWDRYRYIHLSPAASLVREARTTLAGHADRDQLLMVHFMEPHIPYDEPSQFRSLFAGPDPTGLPAPLGRAKVNRWAPGDDGFEKVRDYLIARYDQNIRAVDHALGPLLEAAGDDATVVLFSDHGEAFWEHGEFEHGHGLHEELMRVALAIRSPGVQAGRVAAPVSLLDITPTVLELVGHAPPSTLAGRSLVPLAAGNDEAAKAFAARPHGFGRLLYGPAGWGVQHGTSKWWDQDGYRFLFDLETDPGEATNLVLNRDVPAMEPYAAQLSAALGVPVHHVWRIDLQSSHGNDVTMTVSHPQGLKRAWLSYDPRGRADRPTPVVDDGRVTLVVPAHDDQITAMYVLPEGDPHRPEGLAITYFGSGVSGGERVTASKPLEGGARREIILRLGDPRFSAVVDRVWAPEPVGTDVRGFQPEVEAQLRELGYLE